MILDSGIFTYLILCISGAVAGLFSGIIGIGGGTILVPVQYNLLFNNFGISPDIALRTAIATSLAVTLPTALSSAYGHYKNGIGIPKTGFITGISGFMGGIMGGIISSELSFSLLAPLFACVIFIIAVLMIVTKPVEDTCSCKRGKLVYIVIGFSVGVLSAMVGIGGGIILAPLLIIFCKLPFQISSATTSIFVVGVSAGGLLTFIFRGGDNLVLPFITLGYLNLTWWILLVLISVLMARIGVFLLYRINIVYAKYIFIVLLLCLSLNMLGIF
ncbi:MAG: sulfite exporter TauE/SafE family protein [Methanomicrobium sp.]|nr:sulfite exporter TauE/SafE family protein [Methanomicrobium sp.]